MNKKLKNFFANPSKGAMIFFFVICFVSNILLILSATDLFRESLFQAKNILLTGIMSLSILTTFKLYTNFLKNKYSK